jgi:ABC-type phosphate transport system substrate-binding protein
MRHQLQKTTLRLLRVAALGAAALVPLLLSGAAQAQTACATLFPQHVVYIYGSSAIRPVIANLAYSLAVAGDPLTLVYGGDSVGGGSCTGVSWALQTNMTGTASYWPPDHAYDPNNVDPLTSKVPPPCALPTDQRADVAASDVYPTSCPQIDASLLNGFFDFNPGFAQSMVFIKQTVDATTPDAISEEAAYLTFGLGADSTTEWSDPTKIFIREEASGTMQMIARAIGVPANKFVKAAANANVVTATSDMASRVQGQAGAIGYIATTDADKYPGVKALGFQAAGQNCAYLPNSSSATHDKANVRDGHYPIWGRFHLIAPVDGQNAPTNPDVARLLRLLSGEEQVTGINVLDLLIANNTIPLCAMHVTRDSELGAMMSYMPDKSCSCYMDAKSGGSISGCTTCQTDDDCKATPDTPTCNHWGLNNDGYCEVQ